MEKFLIRKKPDAPVEIQDSSSDSSCNDNSGPPCKKKYKTRKFRSEWLGQFPWLQNKNDISYCIACDKKLSNHRSYLNKHGSLPTHLQNVETKKQVVNIQNFIEKEDQLLSKQVQHAELTLVMFLVCHNLPFLLMDFLPALLKVCCPDSKIAAALQCGRTKSTEIAEKLGSKAKDNLVRKLKSSKFSLIVDETTDVATKKMLVLIVRYFDKLTYRVHDMFSTLIELKNCDANSIYEAIKKFFGDHDVPLKNIIGLATDGANVMAGQFNGLRAKFKPDTDIFYLKCSCHSLHLCSAYACKKLPHEIEELCRNIYCFFSHSPQRIGELREFQDYCAVKPHKILGISLTRWLALEQVINRMLEQWTPIYLYFLDKVLEVNGIKASVLATEMSKPEVKAYLMFLSYVLKIINDLNKEFQSENVRLPYLHLHMEMNFKMILSNFMNHKYVKNLHSLENLDLLDESNYLPIEKIFIGNKAETYLEQSKLSNLQKKEIKTNILKFYLELLDQIKSRFDFTRADLKNLSIITPAKVLSGCELSIEVLINSFPNLLECDAEDIISQWRLLRFSNLDLDPNMNILQFWEKVASFKNGMQNDCFKELISFVRNLLTLPHSSAAAERSFLELNLVKTKLRNRLCVKTINSIMLSKELCGEKQPHYVWSAKDQFK